MNANEVWAIVPVKDTRNAKQRLAGVLPPALRQALALAMLEDVLAAIFGVEELAGTILVTIDPDASRLAARYGAETLTDGAADGHTGAVVAGARHLVARGRGTMLTLPGDLPLASADEIERLIAAHRPAPSFTIAPAHDEQGSNAIVMSPPDAVPLRFGEDSYFPHLAAARAHGIEPLVVPLPGLAFDIDNPQDLHHFAQLGSMTRAGAFVAAHAADIARAGTSMRNAAGRG